MDSVFLLTILFIFLTALVSAYVARHRRDRCLQDIQGYNVTVEMKNGAIVWGRLAVFSNGLELFYKLPHRDNRGHLETSAISIETQITEIQSIYRYPDGHHNTDNETRKLERIRTHHSGLPRQCSRALFSFINTVRDALNASVGFVITSFNQKSASTLVQTQDQRMAKIGQTVVEATANAYEPILERYIGRRVVAKEVRGENITLEHAGILKEYTAQWIELLDCSLVQEHTFDLSQPERLQLNRDLDFIIYRQPGQDAPMLIVRVENHGSKTLHIERFEAKDYQQVLEADLPPGQAVDINLADLPETALEGINLTSVPQEVALRAEQRGGAAGILTNEIPPLPSLRLIVKATREGDVCLPRRHAFIRHAAEAPNKGWLKEAWGDFSPWIKTYPWRSFWRCLWILGNIIISGLIGWAAAAGLSLGGGIFKISLGAIVGLLYGGGWLIQWSLIIQNELDYGRQLRNRLGLATAFMVLAIVWFIWQLA